MRGHVLDLFTVDPHLPAVAERLDVILASSQHFSFLGFRWVRSGLRSARGEFQDSLEDGAQLPGAGLLL
jgi:hypothetical protein